MREGIARTHASLERACGACGAGGACRPRLGCAWPQRLGSIQRACAQQRSAPQPWPHRRARSLQPSGCVCVTAFTWQMLWSQLLLLCTCSPEAAPSARTCSTLLHRTLAWPSTLGTHRGSYALVCRAKNFMNSHTRRPPSAAPARRVERRATSAPVIQGSHVASQAWNSSGVAASRSRRASPCPSPGAVVNCATGSMISEPDSVQHMSEGKSNTLTCRSRTPSAPLDRHCTQHTCKG
jgi:hypothetical protein